MSQKLKGEGRVISVLSDGSGKRDQSLCPIHDDGNHGHELYRHEREYPAHLHLDNEYLTERYGAKDQLFDLLYL